MVDKHDENGTWRDNLLHVVPYVPGEQTETPGLIKLNTNENPYPPSPAVMAAIRRFDAGVLRRYPDGDAGILRSAIANYYGVPAGRVFAGNGSDEVLALAFKACFNSQRPVLFPDITYSFYPVWCQFFGISFEELPLDEAFRVRADDYDRPNGGIVLANPNAPTGIREGADFIEYLLKNNRDSVVIIDEAYTDFGGYSALPLVDQYENLLVVKTFSKSRSLAGMRIGFCVGSETLIAALDEAKNAFNSYTVSGFTAEVGKASLEDENYFREQLEKVLRVRDKSMKTLRDMGFTVLESRANFIFASHERISARALYEFLKKNHILVRHFDKPRIDNFLRVSIGTEDDMNKLTERILEYMDRKGI
ncbi:MAG: aminotransferase class I/II-fold pyridoxal phosphate-dependent enzyme [Clostridiales Family XIII bacterium]|jgi:histidinol-phosphate aminotransferase|nr:aminotransferase class I/II-fold pyridoxal phosphate-dependent enzyme [Clostridiales Family XIII bacterium]